VVLGWIPGSHPAFSFRDNVREATKNQMPIEYANVEWALFPKTIYYTRVSDGVRLSTLGVSLQVIKQAAGQVDVKLLPLPQPPVRARTDARTNPSAQRATQLRSVLARVYTV
jgi:hypothetical protein